MPEVSTPESSSTPASGKDVHSYSCISCKQRKVKCNRTDPCSTCIRIHAECIYRAPAPPKRRKRSANDDDLLNRLNRYEQLLLDYGSILNVVERKDSMMPEQSLKKKQEFSSFKRRRGSDNVRGQDLVVSEFQKHESGKMITEEGNPRYIEKYVHP
jgi:hypothetical protein